MFVLQALGEVKFQFKDKESARSYVFTIARALHVSNVFGKTT